ncbi:MAG: DUF2015 domain-containing protein [Fusobacteriaceae bacterium]|nr:DUF2015 domain-containing protein [Fusobacteriaceae bacterium]
MMFFILSISGMTASAPNPTVYITPTGSVYHLYRECPRIAGSKNVKSVSLKSVKDNRGKCRVCVENEEILEIAEEEGISFEEAQERYDNGGYDEIKEIMDEEGVDYEEARQMYEDEEYDW